MNSFKWGFKYIKADLFMEIMALLLLLICTVLQVVNPLIVGKIIDEVINKGQSEKLLNYLLIMFLVTFAKTVFRVIYQMLFELAGQNALYRLRQDMYRKLHELDFDYYNHTKVGDIMARMTGDTDAIRHFLSWVWNTILENILWFVSALIVMSSINVPLTVLMLIVVPVIYYLTSRMSKESFPAFFEIRESFSRLNSMVEENISGNRVVKAFTREAHEIDKFNQVNDDYMEKNMASAKISAKYLPWLDFYSGILSVLTLLFGGYFVMKGSMTIGDMVAFNGYLWLLNNPLRMSGWLINDVQRYMASTIKIRDLLERESVLTEISETEVTNFTGDIKFEDVSFHFSDDETNNVLDHISFEVKAGQKVGILGQTGSGKSTLVNMISRFYDPSEGKVYVSGKNVKEWPLRLVRDKVSMVMQDVFLFSNTIQENIAFSNPEMSFNKIEQVARIADAKSFIERMPEGYETIVGERGVGLSGGQKQRISLARALAKEPAVLILDDTTSAVDMTTESKIQQALEESTHDMTTFIIAHRISSVKSADLILVMEKGHIVEQGNHEQLLENKGLYWTIYQKQLGLSEAEVTN